MKTIKTPRATRPGPRIAAIIEAGGSAWAIGPARRTIAEAQADARAFLRSEAARQRDDGWEGSHAIEWTREAEEIEDAQECHGGFRVGPMTADTPEGPGWAAGRIGRVLRVGFSDAAIDGNAIIATIEE